MLGDKTCLIDIIISLIKQDVNNYINNKSDLIALIGNFLRSKCNLSTTSP